MVSTSQSSSPQNLPVQRVIVAYPKTEQKFMEAKLTSTDGFTEALSNQGLKLSAPSLSVLDVAIGLTFLQSMTVITLTYGIVSLPPLPKQPLP